MSLVSTKNKNTIHVFENPNLIYPICSNNFSIQFRAIHQNNNKCISRYFTYVFGSAPFKDLIVIVIYLCRFFCFTPFNKLQSLKLGALVKCSGEFISHITIKPTNYTTDNEHRIVWSFCYRQLCFGCQVHISTICNCCTYVVRGIFGWGEAAVSHVIDYATEMLHKTIECIIIAMGIF